MKTGTSFEETRHQNERILSSSYGLLDTNHEPGPALLSRVDAAMREGRIEEILTHYLRGT